MAQGRSPPAPDIAQSFVIGFGVLANSSCDCSTRIFLACKPSMMRSQSSSSNDRTNNLGLPCKPPNRCGTNMPRLHPHLPVDADDGTQGGRVAAQTKYAADRCVALRRHRLPDAHVTSAPRQVIPCRKLDEPAVDRHGDHLQDQAALSQATQGARRPT